MNSKELRIGNLFRTISDEVRTVDLNELKRIQRMPQLYYPIKLTEEWLLNIKGYEVLESFDDLEIIRFDKITKKNCNVFELEILYDGYYYERGKIEFVHDLQNCYYYHSNQKKELEITV